MLQVYTEDNYYTRFDIYSYYCCRETHLPKIYVSHLRAKKSIPGGHSVCSKSVPRTITIQGLTFTAITVAEKHIYQRFMSVT